MTILAQQIEQMRSRMDEIAKSEGRLVAQLADQLNRADEKLLNDVVGLAGEYQARRGTVLRELQSLGRRLGKFPRQLDQFDEEERAPLELESHQTIPLNLSAPARGGWRDGLLLDDAINNLLRYRKTG